jgi:cell division septum initiation protein DivIVA
MTRDIIERSKHCPDMCDCDDEPCLLYELRAEVERLRARLAEWENSHVSPPLMKAQAEIERLQKTLNVAARLGEKARAEVARLTQDTNVLHADICAENDNLRAEVERLTEEVNALRLVATAHDAEVERLRSPFMKDPKPDLRALLPELAVIRQVMKDTKP